MLTVIQKIMIYINKNMCYEQNSYHINTLCDTKQHKFKVQNVDIESECKYKGVKEV